MQRVTLAEPFRMELGTTPEPEPAADEALVRVRRIGICGTDLHAYRGRQPYFNYPRVLGHEIAGEIIEIGENAQGLKPGDTCVVAPYLWCGVCIACRQGKTNCCTQLKLLGVRLDGGLQELLAVRPRALLRADGLTLEQMALVENQSIGAHAAARAALTPGETVLVIGAGPIGLGVAQFARLAGARVLLADLSATRLDFARRWIAPEACLDAGADLPAQLAELTAGDFPTVVFDCTGSPPSMMAAFNLVAHGGRLILVSIVQGELSFNDPDFHRRELTLMSSRNAALDDFRRVIAAMAADQIITAPLTTHHVGLADLPAALPGWLTPEAGVIKAMVELNQEAPMNVDSHQHFWQYDPAAYPWMAAEAMAPLRRDYGPADLLPLLQAANIQATVAVQASQTLAETEWLLDLSDQHDFIRGVVGWVDLQSPQVREQISQYVLRRRFVGVRHIVHDEADERFMLRADFLRGLAVLAEFELTYDLLLRPQHLPVAVEVVRQFPRQRFVVDHIAKPLIKDGRLSPWDDDLRALARFDNVYCKVSGMVTEAAWRGWQAEDFKPYLDVVFDCFGAGRLMFGSDWPVAVLAAAYAEVVSLTRDYVRRLGAEAEAAVMGGNAVQFYELA